MARFDLPIPGSLRREVPGIQFFKIQITEIHQYFIDIDGFCGLLSIVKVHNLGYIIF